MRQNVRRRGQELVARGQIATHLKLKHVQIDLAQDLIFCQSDERVDHRVREHIAPDVGVVSDVGDEFVVSHDQVITMVTLPTNPYPVTKVWGG